MKNNVIGIEEKTKLKIVGDIDITDIDGEKVIMDLNQGNYYMFNEVASCIWNQANDCKTVEEIVDELVSKYEVDTNECRQQVIEFIGKLIEMKLVSIE